MSAPAPNPVPPPPPAHPVWRRDVPAAEKAGRDRARPQTVFVALLILLTVAGAIAVALTWAAPRPAAALVPLAADPAPPQVGRDRAALARSGLFAAATESPASLEGRLRSLET